MLQRETLISFVGFVFCCFQLSLYDWLKVSVFEWLAFMFYNDLIWIWMFQFLYFSLNLHEYPFIISVDLVISMSSFSFSFKRSSSCLVIQRIIECLNIYFEMWLLPKADEFVKKTFEYKSVCLSHSNHKVMHWFMLKCKFHGWMQMTYFNMPDV